MEPENRPNVPEMSFTETESKVLGMLRARYQQDRGLFTVRELLHLQFMRWLRDNPPGDKDSAVQPRSQAPMCAGGMTAGQNLTDTPWCAL
jgi:hypothetical protein